MLPFIYPPDRSSRWLKASTTSALGAVRYYPLELFQFSSNSSRLLAKIGGYVGMGLSVSPDQKTILFTKSVSNDAHLMMIENFQ